MGNCLSSRFICAGESPVTLVERPEEDEPSFAPGALGITELA